MKLFYQILPPAFIIIAITVLIYCLPLLITFSMNTGIDIGAYWAKVNNQTKGR